MRLQKFKRELAASASPSGRANFPLKWCFFRKWIWSCFTIISNYFPLRVSVGIWTWSPSNSSPLLSPTKIIMQWREDVLLITPPWTPPFSETVAFWCGETVSLPLVTLSGYVCLQMYVTWMAFWKMFIINDNSIGGSKVGASPGAPRVQILSFSCSFRQKNCKIIPIWELRTFNRRTKSRRRTTEDHIQNVP